ncbi:MAG: cation diffusion facilitator family transporter [Proteobacteria bacterium]|nr:cation diffusion facilitator family transporter [Pseudomonadota bacterium]
MPEATAEIGNQTKAASRLPSAEAGRLMKLATYASVSVAAVLVAAKFAAWLVTDAVSLLSTLIDSLMDAGASLLNLLAVRHALEPADKEHRFGHGKAEPLAGLAQAAFICGSAVFLVIEAGERLFNPRTIENTEVGYGVMALAIVLTLILVAFQRYVVGKTGSIAIAADSAHYQMDILVNAGVILSLWLVSAFGWTLADPLIALIIAGYIFWGARRIGLIAYQMLMDRELEDGERQKILDIALSHPGVKGLHDLRTRSSGNQVFIQMHLEMDGEISLLEAHTISDAVEASVLEAFPNAEVLIHEDPEGVEEKKAVFH